MYITFRIKQKKITTTNAAKIKKTKQTECNKVSKRRNDGNKNTKKRSKKNEREMEDDGNGIVHTSRYAHNIIHE